MSAHDRFLSLLSPIKTVVDVDLFSPSEHELCLRTILDGAQPRIGH